MASSKLCYGFDLSTVCRVFLFEISSFICWCKVSGSENAKRFLRKNKHLDTQKTHENILRNKLKLKFEPKTKQIGINASTKTKYDLQHTTRYLINLFKCRIYFLQFTDNLTRYPYSSQQKNISPKTICQKNISLNVLFPELTFVRNHACQNEHLPEVTSARMNTCLIVHLPECTFGRNYISPKTYFPESTLAGMYIWPKLHFPESLFSRIYTFQNVHLAEITFSRKFIFQILYTLNRNFVVDRIYISKICNYACSFSKIIMLRVE